jgi:hypothetical protein
VVEPSAQRVGLGALQRAHPMRMQRSQQPKVHGCLLVVRVKRFMCTTAMQHDFAIVSPCQQTA